MIEMRERSRRRLPRVLCNLASLISQVPNVFGKLLRAFEQMLKYSRRQSVRDVNTDTPLSNQIYRLEVIEYFFSRWRTRSLCPLTEIHIRFRKARLQFYRYLHRGTPSWQIRPRTRDVISGSVESFPPFP